MTTTGLRLVVAADYTVLTEPLDGDFVMTEEMIRALSEGFREKGCALTASEAMSLLKNLGFIDS